MKCSLLFVGIAVGALLGIRQLPAAEGRQVEKKATAAASEATPSPLTTRRMEEMTSREVQQYFASGGDLVLIPFSPVSFADQFSLRTNSGPD
jgi:hypothetical protein